MLTLVWLSCCLAVSPAAASNRRSIRTAGGGWVSVVVSLAGPLTTMQETRLRHLDADIYRHLPLFHSVALRLPRRNLGYLTALDGIRHVTEDETVRKCDEFTAGSSGAAWVYQQYALDGTGVTVAVVDSGVAAAGQADLNAAGGRSRVIGSANFSTGTGDLCGHGTHVSGIVAGNGAVSSANNCYRHFYGIARNVNLVDVRVLGSNGQGTVSTVMAGIQWVVQNKSAYKIRVLNLSLGHPVGESYKTDPLCQAVEQAWKAGIVVVCAAGNAGRLDSIQTTGMANEGWGTAYGSIQSPANDPLVITVGATKSVDVNRADDRIATYSSRGPTRLDLICKPDIIAPGNRVLSLEAPGSYLATYAGGTNCIPLSAYVTNGPNRPSQEYFSLSGTSMAAPVVAGAAALLLQKDPTLSPDTIKARLMMTADKWADPSGNADALTYGAGYLDIPWALTSTYVANTPAVSPVLLRDSQGDVTLSPNGLIAGGTLWGTGVTDLRVIWGTGGVSTNGILTDSRVIWGTSVWTDASVVPISSDGVDLSSTAIGGE